MDSVLDSNNPYHRDVLVLGASIEPSRYSYKAANRLAEQGYSTFLLGKTVGTIRGQDILTTLPAEAKVDTLTIYINPTIQHAVPDLVVRHGIRRVIFNPGTENPGLENLLRSRDVEVEEACTLVLLSIGKF